MKFVMLMHIGLPDTTRQNQSNYNNATWQTVLILKDQEGTIFLHTVGRINRK